MTYKLNVYNEILTGIIYLPTNAYIPIDTDNTDYQEYLTWLAEGNEPLPADES